MSYYCVAQDQTTFDEVKQVLGVPFIVKPSRQGSSFGVHKVNNAEEYRQAYADAARFNDDVIVEQYACGPEYSVTILGDRVMEPLRIESPNEIFDFDAKYINEGRRFHVPSGLSQEQVAEAQAMALSAFNSLGCRHFARVDMIQDEQGKLWLLELNTIPGLTEESQAPFAARASGISFQRFILGIIEQTLDES